MYKNISYSDLIGMANSIDTYLRLKICVVWVEILSLKYVLIEFTTKSESDCIFISEVFKTNV